MPSGSGEGDFQRFLLFKPWRPSSLFMPSFKIVGLLVLEKKIFKGICYI